MIKIKQLHAEECWNTVSVMIEKAVDLSNGRHTLSSTYEKLNAGVMKLFGIFNDDFLIGAFVSQVMIYPAKQVYCVLFIGGTGLINHMKTIIDFFRVESIRSGCKGVEIIGRKGWSKINKKLNLNFIEKGMYYEMDT
mgnify:CR=1 FL=1|tara:strand:+ start:2086 stop:2496 length:411 start_codon:yes stop_codon:yes gene_type:complete